MQILVTGDIHYALRQYDWLLGVAERYDAVVIAGDLLEIASSVDPAAQIVVVRKYLTRIAERTRLVVCSGNHDLNATLPDGERVADWFNTLRDLGIVVDGMSAEMGNAVISVFPWWDGPAVKAMIAEQLARDAGRAGPLWLWVYHAPPTDSPTSWSGSRHFGDPELTSWLELYQPALVLCGHVHQAPFIGSGSWADRVGTSWVFNMGQQPGEVPSHIIVDTVVRKAVWLSFQGSEELDLADGAAVPQPLRAEPAWVRA